MKKIVSLNKNISYYYIKFAGKFFEVLLYKRAVFVPLYLYVVIL